MNERVVIDSSYLLEAVVPTSGEWQSEAIALMDGLAALEIAGVVPWICFLELASVCSKRVRGGKLDRYDAQGFLSSVTELGLHVDMQLQWPLELYEDSMAIQTQTYDTMYLMLAKRMGGLPIATRDKGMQAGARALRLPLYAH